MQRQLSVQRLLIQKILGDKPVAYHPILAKLTGSVTTAIWLSQIIYWDSTLREERDGWFWKTYEEMGTETCLNRHEQDRARADCKKLDIIEENKKGLPLRLFYKVKWESLTSLLERLSDADPQVCHTPTNKSDIRQQAISESTTESTSISEKTLSDSDFPTPQPREQLNATQWKQRIAEAVVIGEDNVRRGKKKGLSDPREAEKEERKKLQNDVVSIWSQDGLPCLPDKESIAKKIALDHYISIQKGDITWEQWHNAVERLLGDSRYISKDLKIDMWNVGKDIDDAIRGQVSPLRVTSRGRNLGE